MPSAPAPIGEVTLDAARKTISRFPITLVTGGSGYIGSHTVLELLLAGSAVVVLDNLYNSHMESLSRVWHIINNDFARWGIDKSEIPPLYFHKADLQDRRSLEAIFMTWQTSSAPIKSKAEFTNVGARYENEKLGAVYKMKEYSGKPQRPELINSVGDKSKHGKISAVIHFAALKAVGESVMKPLQYYQNNITGLLNLMDVMEAYRVKNLVFSSSAVIYGQGKESNISEDSVSVGGRGAGGGLVTNPYGRSKWMAEEILNDWCIAHRDYNVIALRYFNPTGSHPSGLIGEDPKGVPNNIIPVIMQAYQRRRSKVYVYGSNYDTNDGTGVRDYIHVSDLANGHLAALRSIFAPAAPEPEKKPKEDSLAVGPPAPELEVRDNYRVYNLGTGHGYSVLDILQAFSGVAGSEIPFAISEARPGDLGTVTANASKAQNELGWQAEFDLQDMCRDVFNWAAENPVGYERLRRLSTLAGLDPKAMRKASIAVGLMPDAANAGSNNTNQLGGYLNSLTTLTKDRGAFNEMIRRLSVMHEGILEKSIQEEATHPEVGSVPVPEKQWGMFGDAWKDQDLPIRKGSGSGNLAPPVL